MNHGMRLLLPTVGVLLHATPVLAQAEAQARHRDAVYEETLHKARALRSAAVESWRFI